MARSTWVDHVFKWGKLLKCHLKGKASRKLANGQNIDYSENKEENGPRASSAPTLGLNTIIFKHVYWYMQQISGECLQDHWSSVFQLWHICNCFVYEVLFPLDQGMQSTSLISDIISSVILWLFVCLSLGLISHSAIFQSYQD